jgi:excisionase family DNA binding protein
MFQGIKRGRMEAGQLMTVKEVAEYLRLKPLAIYRMVKSKDIPFRRANRSLRFDKGEIDEWMKWGKR